MKKNNSIIIEKISNTDLNLSNVLSTLSLPRNLENIGIKLNLCDYRLPETGAVSDPNVVDSLLKALRTNYPETNIFLMENDATSVNADLMFKYLGIDRIATKYSVKLVNLARSEWVSKKIDGYLTKSIDIPAIIENCDLLISHPKLKTHSMTKITCGLKNMFGCYRLKNKKKLHKSLDEAIADINLALNPNVSIVDANICMEGLFGPCNGVPRKLGLIIGGADIVSVDSFCAQLIGFNPWFVGHIRKSAAKKLGTMEYILDDNMEIPDKETCRFEFNRSLYYVLKVVRKLGGGIA